MPEPWPTKITLAKDGLTLTIDFDDGARVVLAAKALRLATPSVEAKRLTAEERRALIGERTVRITSVEPVGNYAIRPSFDDGHASGIYAWSYLRALAAPEGPE